MHIVERSQRHPDSGTSRKFQVTGSRSRLPRVSFQDSVVELAAPAPAATLSVRRAPPAPGGSGPDVLRLIGMATVGIGTVVGILWLLGRLFEIGGPAELQRFNAGHPVMECTAGGYRAVDDSLLGRVFGERYFACRDWKMGS